MGWLARALLFTMLLSFIPALVKPDQTLLWTASDGLPTMDARAAIASLASAGDDGLDPSDYDAAALSRLAARLEERPDPHDAVSFDSALTAAMLQFFHDLHAGRVDPRAAGCSYRIDRDEPDYEAQLRQAVERHQLGDAIARLRPAFRQYEALRTMLVSSRDQSPASPRRVRQIELALERLRWLQPLRDEHVIVVNIPMFRLWAFDGSRPQSAPELTMNVIVGRAWKTQTPLLEGRMTNVVFRPPWNVPSSIVRGEILPKLQRDPAYLAKEDMEILIGEGVRERAVPLSAAAIEQLRRGVARIRQRPGPRNALGLVKFVFPNDADVYMHGTPQQALFQKARRDFSHGCVRVEDPVALAEWVLTGNGDWPKERIERAIDGAASQTVMPVASVHVILFYTTAAVMPDGTMQFAEDVYGFDAKLERALAAAKCSRSH
jgi:murein L,D-transpeptidase YcbB/YkuD